MNLGVVLDVSVALTWCFEDEMTAEGLQLLADLGAKPIVVPALWHTELANALLVGERRGRIDASAIETFLAMVQDLSVETDAAGDPAVIKRVMIFARQHGLTAYDAACLELAARRDLPLATRDAALRRAAAQSGIGLIAV